MKKSYLTIIAVSALIIVFLIGLNCIFFGKPKQYTSFFTDQTVSIWKNYVIFEQYDGRMAPKDNFIKLVKSGGNYICVFFKKNNTITIWSESEKPIETNFDKELYDVKIYYGSDNISKYYDECKYSDSLTVVEYKIKTYRLIEPVISINEITADSVYVSHQEKDLYYSTTTKLKCVYPRDYEGFKR